MHYDEKYFEYQKEIGAFGGWAEQWKFLSYISPKDTVVDFGCGGGFLLRRLECARKFGVELNDTARLFAEHENGITAVKYVDDLEDNIADIIISNHALEHCHAPHAELTRLLTKLKPGGQIIFYVPSESSARAWTTGNKHMHIYTWNPTTLGNLFSSAGFEVLSAVMVFHFWPPYYRKIALFGWPTFDLACRVFGLLKKNYAQVRIEARRHLAK